MLPWKTGQFWCVPRANVAQNRSFFGTVRRTSRATRGPATTWPFADSMRHVTSAGVTGNPCQRPGTGREGMSIASATKTPRTIVIASTRGTVLSRYGVSRPGSKRVDRPAALEVRQVHVLALLLHEAEQRPPSDCALADAHGRLDVPVLEPAPVAAIDGYAIAASPHHRARGDGDGAPSGAEMSSP